MPNDNRVAAGTHTDSAYEVRLEARLARWLPDSAMDSTLTVQAFAAADGAPRIPGPLLRVVRGKRVRVTVTNSIPDSTLVVHGLMGSAGADSLVVPSGERREISFTAGVPGTYLYWGSTTGQRITSRTLRDGQLTGAFVVDDDSATPDSSERILVLTTLDILPDTTRPIEQRDDIFEQAINGLQWPYTERLRATAGESVRYRVVNGSYLPHPMHLHGFHFRVLAKGNGPVDTLYAAGTEPSVVTEMMRSGTTMRMEFVPTRPGQWLFHCHMLAHITPFPPRADSVRAADHHDAARHARGAMSGLVMGIEVAPRAGVTPESLPPLRSRHRIVAQEARADSGTGPRGFVLDRGGAIDGDSVEIPGSLLLLRRGERTEITVVNRLTQATSVHWHGMELDPYFDGVAGFSGEGARTTPMIAPGDSFTVSFTPPRAGTFMYHTHMEEEPQLHYGMFGPLLVLDPGERYDPSTDHLVVLGEVRAGRDGGPLINGRRAPDPIILRPDVSHRFRLINILATEPVIVTFRTDTIPLEWTPVAKDGADLPAARRSPTRARFLSGVGETYDFRWTPGGVKGAEFVINAAIGGPDTLRLPVRVRR